MPTKKSKSKGQKKTGPAEKPDLPLVPKYPFDFPRHETYEPTVDELRLYWIVWKTWGKEGRADTADLAEWKRYLIQDCGHKLEDVKAFSYSDALKVTQKAFGRNFRKVQERIKAKHQALKTDEKTPGIQPIEQEDRPEADISRKLPDEKTPGPKPLLMRATVAVTQFCVSIPTIRRLIKKGDLTDHRLKGSKKNAPLVIDCVELASLYTRKKQ